jgi:tRNA threonylcarbamoyladenosine biosynthesis protein TsaE
MRNIQRSIVCEKAEELDLAAKKIIQFFPKSKIFAFHGELGAGKTTLIKSLCHELGVVDTVNSPTFTIINVYKTENNEEVFHFDLYRLTSESEALDIGYEEYIYNDSYCFIEWPEKISNLLPSETIHIYLEVDSSNNFRTIRF